jgi:alkaline phosphatase D
MSRLDRRQLLQVSSALAATFWMSGKSWGIVRNRVSLLDNPFTLGVASGDPSSDGFVLWTRLAPQPVLGGGMPQENIEVTWELLSDDDKVNVLKTGTFVATPEMAHAVHVELSGLEADRWYRYRFHAAGYTSPIGRTRTFPAADVMPERMRMAFASCQHYETGFYNAYEHMAKADLDMVIHLGDYIYEGGIRKNSVRQHNGPEIVTLEDYRNRHALYKTDPHLQATHAAFPWLVTWDDHEFDNNYADDISEEKNVDPQKFMQRRADAYKAYYENMPLRKVQLPTGPNMRLYRSMSFGRLANLAVLDTRQYRTDQPNNDKQSDLIGDVMRSDAEMLGKEQEQWLQEELKASQATWNVLAQQVMMARVDRRPGEERGFSMDQWSGYEVPRRRLMSFLKDNSIANPVVLTGDIHCNWVNDLKIDFDNEKEAVIATEFVGTSISSGGDGVDKLETTDTMYSENPFVKFFNAQRGYVDCTITPKGWTSEYKIVPFVTKPGAPLTTRATFAVEAGRAGANKISG